MIISTWLLYTYYFDMDTLKGILGPLPLPVILAPIATVLAIRLYLKLSKAYGFWSEQGVKGQWTIPYLGPLFAMLTADRLEGERQRRDNYGKIYVQPAIDGQPRLVVCDPEVIRQILVKDFDIFTDHMMPPYPNKYQSNFLVWLKGDHWKMVRGLMTPSFTSGKIKRMFRFLQGCADDLVEHFNEQLSLGGQRKQAIVKLADIYGMFTADGITTCGYGLKLKRESGDTNIQTAATRNDFVKCMMNILHTNLWRLLYPAFLPKFLLKLIDFSLAPNDKYEPMIQRVNGIVERRRQSNLEGRYDDLLQMLVDANLDDKLELNELDTAENHHAGLTHEELRKDHEKMVESVTKAGRSKLSDMEVLSEAAFILVAGMDTTRILLTNCTYCLAFHPKIQEKLYEELKSIAERDPENEKNYAFTYEAITSCHYLDAVISESLRLFPPVIQTSRVAGGDYKIEKYNVTVPKGSLVSAGVYAVHTDPDFWYKPLKFDPDRFMPGNKEKIVSGSYLPFGLGPRHCIGMRFSLTEAKIGLAKTIMHFKFSPRPGSVFPPKPAARLTLLALKDTRVKIEARV